MSKPIKLSFNQYKYHEKINGYDYRGTTYYVFRVFINGVEISEFSQMNHFFESVRQYNDVLAEAQGYVMRVSHALGVPFPKLTKFEKKTVPQVEQWVEYDE